MTIGFIHSTQLVIPWIEAAFAPFALRATALHALDEALIVELAKGRGVTEGALRRLRFMAESLAEAGADRLVLSCSSLSPAVDELAPRLPVPLVKSDEAMMRAAVASGRPFAVLATNPSTRQPIRIIVEAVAARLGADPKWTYELLGGAFDALKGGDAEGHDAEVVRAYESLAEAGSAIYFAQISMARALPRLSPAAKTAVRTSLDFMEETAFGRL